MSKGEKSTMGKDGCLFLVGVPFSSGFRKGGAGGGE